MSTPKRTHVKDLSVETLRGIAIILVVMGHVIGSGSDGGMKVEDDSFLRHLYYTFQYLRMPLFTVISGWVYSLKPVAIGTGTKFMQKKTRRVILPMIFVGATYYILQYMVPGTNYSYSLTAIWKILFFPYTFFWYLYSLFIVYIVITVIDANNWCRTFNNWVVVFALSIGLLAIRNVFIPETAPNIFGYKGAIYLLPFFVVGVGINRFKEHFSNQHFIGILIGLVLAALVVQQLAWYKIIDYQLSNRGGLGLFIGVGGTILCLQIRFSIKWLVWIGNYAYTIFLFHSFGTSGGRILLNAGGINNTLVVFTVSLLLGLLMPVVADAVLDRFKLTRMFFLGRALNKH